MAINPDEINLVKYTEVPSSVINTNDIMTKSDDLGIVTHFKISSLVSYLVPRVASGRSSSYVDIIGFDLPSPSSNNAFSWVGPGQYMLNGEVAFIATYDINQIFWDGVYWEIIQEITASPLPTPSNESFIII